MKNWGVRQPVGRWQTSRTDQKHMGNLQSERISSEENRNSFFPTATTVGKDFRIRWASERQVLSSSRSSSAQRQPPQAEREKELVLDCVMSRFASAWEVDRLPHEAETELSHVKGSLLPRRKTNGDALLALMFGVFCWLFEAANSAERLLRGQVSLILGTCFS